MVMWWNCHDCSDIANSCRSGSVRLTDGLIPTEGTVEVCYNGAWNSVCDSDWGYQEAFVVCRQLGLPATGTVIYWFHTTHVICWQMHKLCITAIHLDMGMGYQHSTTGDALEMKQIWMTAYSLHQAALIVTVVSIGWLVLYAKEASYQVTNNNIDSY